MTSYRPSKRVTLEIHQVRTLLEVCEGTSQLSGARPLDTALKEAGEEAKGILWSAIKTQDLRKITRVTLEAASKTFKRRKRACRTKRRLGKLKNEFQRTGLHPKRYWTLCRWRSAEARSEGQRPLESTVLDKKWFQAVDVDRELREVEGSIKQAEKQLKKYKTYHTAKDGFSAADWLERGNESVRDGTAKLKGIIPVWYESSDEEYSSAASDSEVDIDSD